MKKEDIDKFEKTQTQLEGLFEEISILAKKSPNDGVNKFKLKFINEILLAGNRILGKNYKPLDSFEQFNDEELPSNSDVTFILSQYLNCFEKLRADNIHSQTIRIGHTATTQWYWSIENDKSNIKTAAPKKIK